MPTNPPPPSPHTSNMSISTISTAREKYYSMMNMDIFKDTLESSSKSNSATFLNSLTLKSSKQATFHTKDQTQTIKIQKSRLTVFFLGLLLIGLITMIGTILSVQTEEAELEVHKKFSTSEDKEKPVTFI